MKALLFGIFTLQLVLAGNEVYGTNNPQLKKTTVDRIGDNHALTLTESTLVSPSTAALKVTKRPTIDLSKLDMALGMAYLGRRFGSVPIDGTNDTEIAQIDISYPSFLNFIHSVCLKNNSAEFQSLKNYVLSIISPNYVKNNADTIFDELFEVEEYSGSGSEPDYLKEFKKSYPSKTFKEVIKEKFKKLADNITFQQRIKTLLILRKITKEKIDSDVNLEILPENLAIEILSKAFKFGFSPLPKIKLRLGAESHAASPKLKGIDLDEYAIELNPSASDYVKISDNSSQTITDGLSQALLHEMTHIYHHVINLPIGDRPISQLSWGFDDNIVILNPWRCAEISDKAVEGINAYFIDRAENDRTQPGVVNVIKTTISRLATKLGKTIRNTADLIRELEKIKAKNNKTSTDSQDIKEMKKTINALASQIGVDKAAKEMMNKFTDIWGESWTNLEEVLTILGMAPVDIKDYCGQGRYRVIDRQNQSSELNRSIKAYRLLHSGKLSLFNDQKMNDNFQKIVLDTLRKSSSYKLYQSGDGVDQNSPSMVIAEKAFEKAFKIEFLKEIVTLLDPDNVTQKMKNFYSEDETSLEVSTRFTELEKYLKEIRLISIIKELPGMSEKLQATIETLNKNKIGVYLWKEWSSEHSQLKQNIKKRKVQLIENQLKLMSVIAEIQLNLLNYIDEQFSQINDQSIEEVRLKIVNKISLEDLTSAITDNFRILKAKNEEREKLRLKILKWLNIRDEKVMEFGTIEDKGWNVRTRGSTLKIGNAQEKEIEAIVNLLKTSDKNDQKQKDDCEAARDRLNALDVHGNPEIQKWKEMALAWIAEKLK